MTRTVAASKRLRRRPSRTVPATIVAVGLLALGVLAAIAAVGRLVTGAWPRAVTDAAGAVSDYTWATPAVIVAGGVAALLGLILVIAALTPGRYRVAELHLADADTTVRDTDYVISTRALARLAAAKADQVDGVDRVAASASGRRVHVRITTTSEQGMQIRERVLSAVTDALSATGVQPMPRITAVVRTKEI